MDRNVWGKETRYPAHGCPLRTQNKKVIETSSAALRGSTIPKSSMSISESSKGAWAEGTLKIVEIMWVNIGSLVICVAKLYNKNSILYITEAKEASMSITHIPVNLGIEDLEIIEVKINR